MDSTASRLLKVLNHGLNGLNVFLCLFPTLMDPVTHISLALHNFNTDTPENPHLLNVSEIYCRRMIPCMVCKRSQRRKELKSKEQAKAWRNSLVIETSLNLGDIVEITCSITHRDCLAVDSKEGRNHTNGLSAAD